MSRAALAPLLTLATALASVALAGPRPLPDLLDQKPDAVVDLRTREGARLVRAAWRSSPVSFQEVDSRAPGSDRKPSGPSVRTVDLVPRAGRMDFDDASWEVVDPTELEDRRGDGRLSFVWYRLDFTLPDAIGSTPVPGATVVFEIVVDDYAEVWVDGKLPRVLGAEGGSLIRGFNAPNRIVIARNARPVPRPLHPPHQIPVACLRSRPACAASTTRCPACRRRSARPPVCSASGPTNAARSWSFCSARSFFDVVRTGNTA